MKERRERERRDKKKKRERKKREINCLQRSRERSATVGEREMEIDSERETGSILVGLIKRVVTSAADTDQRRRK